MRSDCPGDKTVDYPGRVIGYANALAGSITSSNVSPSGGGGSSGLLIAALVAVPVIALAWRAAA
jgi:hypothetical protein